MAAAGTGGGPGAARCAAAGKGWPPASSSGSSLAGPCGSEQFPELLVDGPGGVVSPAEKDLPSGKSQHFPTVTGTNRGKQPVRVSSARQSLRLGTAEQRITGPQHCAMATQKFLLFSYCFYLLYTKCSHRNGFICLCVK